MSLARTARTASVLLSMAAGCSVRTDIRAFDDLQPRADEDRGIAGDGSAGDPDPGDTAAGDPDPGDTAAGDADPGDTAAGDADPGDTAAGDADPGDPLTCPTEMVYIPSHNTCIDRWEASDGGGTAASVAGATPWVNVNWSQASSACANTGKSLCPSDVWLAACQGPSATLYPYGDTFDPEACNGLDNPAMVPRADTGSFTGCEGGYDGIFDMSGNVEEWTGTCDVGSCNLGLSSFNSLQEQMSCATIIAMGKTELEDRRGFRCCSVP